MQLKGKNKKKGVSVRIRILMCLLVPLMILYAFVSSLIVNNLKDKTESYFNDMTDLYMKELDQKFFRISRRILMILMNNTMSQNDFDYLAGIIEKSENEVEMVNSISALQTEFTQYMWEYGEEFNFFFYLKGKDNYFNLSMQEPYSLEKEDLVQSIRQMILSEEINTYSTKSAWNTIETQYGNYMIKILKAKDRYLGCYVKADKILDSFSGLHLEDGGFALLVDRKGRYIAGGDPDLKLDFESLAREKRHRNYTIIEKEFVRIPFGVKIYLSNRKTYQSVWLILFSLIGLAVGILAVYGYMLLYLRYGVLKPIREFTSRLLDYDTGNFTYDLSSAKIVELEQADEQFRRLLRQMKKLKITLYETELEQKKLESENLKLQIRPHFYLNCLNFIYSMIDFKAYEDAKAMARITSEYLRYIFRSDVELVLIESELKHVENYLEIIKLRYKDKFDFYIEQNEETKYGKVPVFFIQTFVENSIKHGLSLDRNLFLSVTVFPEEKEGEDYVNIFIYDTGDGFSQEVLEKLSRGEELKESDGSRIGISNCLKKLKLYYEGRGSINFYNRPKGGAVIDIHIPVKE